jgi:hypothetical protein
MFQPAKLVPELSSPARDVRMTVRKDGLEMILTSLRTDLPGSHGPLHYLWFSNRATAQDLWSTPVNLGDTVNTTDIESAAYLSFDGETLFFYSNCPGGVGGNDLYMTTRTEDMGAHLDEARTAALRWDASAPEKYPTPSANVGAGHRNLSDDRTVPPVDPGSAATGPRRHSILSPQSPLKATASTVNDSTGGPKELGPDLLGPAFSVIG